MIANKGIRANINAECAKKGLTKANLAEQLNVSKPTLRNWINGNPIPSDKLTNMAKFFGCPLEYLLETTDYKQTG